MNLRTWLTVVAALGVIFGLGYLVLPAPLLGLFGIQASPSATLATRFFGGSTLGWGLLAWWMRPVREASGLRALTNALLVSFGLGAGLSAWGAASGLFNAIGWVSAGLFLVMAVVTGGLSRGDERGGQEVDSGLW